MQSDSGLYLTWPQKAIEARTLDREPGSRLMSSTSSLVRRISSWAKPVEEDLGAWWCQKPIFPALVDIDLSAESRKAAPSLVESSRAPHASANKARSAAACLFKRFPPQKKFVLLFARFCTQVFPGQQASIRSVDGYLGGTSSCFPGVRVARVSGMRYLIHRRQPKIDHVLSPHLPAESPPSSTPVIGLWRIGTYSTLSSPTTWPHHIVADRLFSWVLSKAPCISRREEELRRRSERASACRQPAT